MMGATQIRFCVHRSAHSTPGSTLAATPENPDDLAIGAFTKVQAGLGPVVAAAVARAPERGSDPPGVRRAGRPATTRIDASPLRVHGGNVAPHRQVNALACDRAGGGDARGDEEEPPATGDCERHAS